MRGAVGPYARPGGSTRVRSRLRGGVAAASGWFWAPHAVCTAQGIEARHLNEQHARVFRAMHEIGMPCTADRLANDLGVSATDAGFIVTLTQLATWDIIENTEAGLRLKETRFPPIAMPL